MRQNRASFVGCTKKIPVVLHGLCNTPLASPPLVADFHRFSTDSGSQRVWESQIRKHFTLVGDRYDWTTGAQHDGNERKKYRVAPRANPSRNPLMLLFNRSVWKQRGFWLSRGDLESLPLYGGTLAQSYSVSNNWNHSGERLQSELEGVRHVLFSNQQDASIT